MAIDAWVCLKSCMRKLAMPAYFNTRWKAFCGLLSGLPSSLPGKMNGLSGSRGCLCSSSIAMAFRITCLDLPLLLVGRNQIFFLYVDILPSCIQRFLPPYAGIKQEFEGAATATRFSSVLSASIKRMISWSDKYRCISLFSWCLLMPNRQSWPCQKHPCTKIVLSLPGKSISGYPVSLFYVGDIDNPFRVLFS